MTRPPQSFVFGDWDAPITDDATEIPVPTTMYCVYCNEQFVEGDNGGIISGWPQHRECGFRMVMGGIGHHVDHGRYCHGELGPDAGLTKRQSALLVWRHLTEHREVTEADLEEARGA